MKTTVRQFAHTRCLTTCAIALPTLLAAGASLAQQNKPMESIVVSANRMARSCFDAAASIDALARARFVPTGQAVPRPSGISIRWSAIILAVALWNALFLLDSTTQRSHHQPGSFSYMALLLLFAAATVVRSSPRFQRFVLREGHQVGEIQPFLVLLQVVTDLLCVVFGIMLLAGASVG
jgi:hypothetical protein